MKADELRNIVYQKPFRPFLVRLVNGESLEVHRPLRTTVAEDRVLFGLNEDTSTGIATKLRIVRLSDIAAVEVTSAA